jgi:hypothetical protein
VPAPKQETGCGFGTTILSKRTLNNSFTSKPTKEKKKEINTSTEVAISKPHNRPSKKNITEDRSPENLPSNKDESPNDILKKEELKQEQSKQTESNSDDVARLEKRKVNLLKTIEIESNHIDVDFYDNGEIDGDTVSVYYNNQLILSKKRLTDRPLHVVLDMDDDVEVNELVMYAENLGTIPPNSAVMIVKDGPNRYEVRISSDLNNSGVIRFKHKK